jgi:BASS family bile acid:Na+ symporter
MLGGAAAHAALKADVAQPIALGLVLLGLMPIAMTSAGWVRMNGGNVPLLLGAFVMTNALAVPIVPIILRRVAGVGHPSIATMQAGAVVEQLTMAILLPVVVGMALRSLAPLFVQRVRPLLLLLSTGGLLATIGSTVSASRPHIDANVTSVTAAGVLTVTFNVGLYLAGLAIVRNAKLGRADAVAVLFASGMRNMGTAAVVATVAFPDSPLVAIPAAMFSISQQLLGGAVTSLLGAYPALLEGGDLVVRVEQPLRQRLGSIPSINPPSVH